MDRDTLIFLSFNDVIYLHHKEIERFGGATGIRDTHLLSSAIAQADLHLFGNPVYSHLYEIAAIYAFHIIKNHPFVDGNKRTGILAAMTFLAINNTSIPIIQKDLLYNLAIQIANGTLTKEGAIDFFKTHLGDQND